MKRFLIILVCFLLLTSCTADVAEHTDTWTVGFSSAELIPEDSDLNRYFIAGYKNDNNATGVLDYQRVKSLYLKADGGELLLIVVDCVGLSSGDIAKMKNELPADLRKIAHVVSTHTHAGIDTLGLWGSLALDGKDAEFMGQLYEKSATTAIEAYKNAKEGKLYYGSSDKGIEKLLYDSRTPNVYDTKLHQIYFKPNDGTSGVRVFNYAAHAESLRGDNSKISADFPRYLADAIKRETGDDSVFMPAAIGGLIMTKRLTDEKGREYPVTENVVKTGELLADCALSMDNMTELSPNLTSVFKGFEIPLDNRVFVTFGALGILNNKIVRSGMGEYGLSVKTSVGLISLGEISIACVPGEIFPELVYGEAEKLGVGNTLSDIFGEDVLIVGLFDDEVGYIVPPSDFRLSSSAPYLDTEKDERGENHYEETNSLGPECAECIIKAFEDIKQKIS